MTTTRNPNARIDGPHCENCGSSSPEDIGGRNGYTSCCNECVCTGCGESRYGVETNFVRACCWAVAEKRFGGPENVPEDSSRLRDR